MGKSAPLPTVTTTTTTNRQSQMSIAQTCFKTALLKTFFKQMSFETSNIRFSKIVWKTLWNFLKKLKMELPLNPAIPLLGLYPTNPESPIQKNLCTPMFIATQFTIAKCWKQPKCPSVNEWVKKLWYIYTMEYYAAERKKELLLFATAWMELESIMLSEISQAVRDKYHMISPLTGT